MHFPFPCPFSCIALFLRPRHATARVEGNFSLFQMPTELALGGALVRLRPFRDLAAVLRE